MRKRHWYQSINWLAPLIWLKDDLAKFYKNHKRFCEVIGYIVCIVIAIVFVLTQLKTIASERDAQIQKKELKRLEQIAIQKENDLKLRQQQKETDRLYQQKQYYQDILQISVDSQNKTYEKMAKQKCPIGTYIKCDVDGEEWIGKIKSIHGREITTTDNWKCYFGDEIQYSEVKEYRQFIKENSKG